MPRPRWRWRLWMAPQSTIRLRRHCRFSLVAATTARSRFLAKPVLAPDGAAPTIFERGTPGWRCGILFGKERTGLENSDIAVADVIVTAPVDPAFASLNLAQSVLLFAYEWRKLANPDSLGRQLPDAPQGAARASRRAVRRSATSFLASSSIWKRNSTHAVFCSRRKSAKPWSTISGPCLRGWNRPSRRCAPFERVFRSSGAAPIPVPGCLEPIRF